MCRTMKELERVVADYRSMKAMKEQIDAQVKSLKEEQLTQRDLRQTQEALQSIRESASTEDYMLNKFLILAVEVNRRKVRI